MTHLLRLKFLKKKTIAQSTVTQIRMNRVDQLVLVQLFWWWCVKARPSWRDKRQFTPDLSLRHKLIAEYNTTPQSSWNNSLALSTRSSVSTKAVLINFEFQWQRRWCQWNEIRPKMLHPKGACNINPLIFLVTSHFEIRSVVVRSLLYGYGRIISVFALSQSIRLVFNYSHQ